MTPQCNARRVRLVKQKNKFELTGLRLSLHLQMTGPSVLPQLEGTTVSSLGL